MSSKSSLTISEIELSIQLLNLDIERELAPPMADLIKASHDIASTMDHAELITEVRSRLLSDGHPFKARLGLLVLRHTVNRFASLSIPIFLEFLTDSHPWNRYEAMWGLVSSRVSDQQILAQIQVLVAANTSTHDADLKLRAMASLFLKAQLRRQHQCADLQTTSHDGVIAGVVFDWPENVSLEVKGKGATYFNGRGTLIAHQERSMIQLSEFNASEIHFTISELAWDEEMSLEHYIKEMIAIGEKLKSAVITSLGDQNQRDIFFSESEKNDGTRKFVRKTILMGTRLFEYSAEMETREVNLWMPRIREIIRSLRPA